MRSGLVGAKWEEHGEWEHTGPPPAFLTCLHREEASQGPACSNLLDRWHSELLTAIKWVKLNRSH